MPDPVCAPPVQLGATWSAVGGKLWELLERVAEQDEPVPAELSGHFGHIFIFREEGIRIGDVVVDRGDQLGRGRGWDRPRERVGGE